LSCVTRDKGKKRSVTHHKGTRDTNLVRGKRKKPTRDLDSKREKKRGGKYN